MPGFRSGNYRAYSFRIEKLTYKNNIWVLTQGAFKRYGKRKSISADFPLLDN